MDQYNCDEGFLCIQKYGKQKNFNVSWRRTTYPKSLVLALIEEDFKWNSGKNCWEAPFNKKTEQAVYRFEKIADDIFSKRNSNKICCISSSEPAYICIKKELELFNALKTDQDYQILKDYLENLTKIFFNINASLWENQNIFFNKQDDGYMRIGFL